MPVVAGFQFCTPPADRLNVCFAVTPQKAAKSRQQKKQQEKNGAAAANGHPPSTSSVVEDPADPYSVGALVDLTPELLSRALDRHLSAPDPLRIRHRVEVLRPTAASAPAYYELKLDLDDKYVEYLDVPGYKPKVRRRRTGHRH
eukprot:COSAG05_NODE_602_length_8420_cov_13.540199_6_plen_144_part_00